MTAVKAKDDSLAEQLAAARAAAEEFLDQKAAELNKQHPSIPVGVLRQQLTARGFGACACVAAMNILNDGK